VPRGFQRKNIEGKRSSLLRGLQLEDGLATRSAQDTAKAFSVVAIMAQSYGWGGGRDLWARDDDSQAEGIISWGVSFDARAHGATASIPVKAAARVRPAQRISASDAAGEIRNSLWACIR